MILDTLNNAKLYESVHPRFAAAFDYLRKAVAAWPGPGTVELQGKDLYAMVQEYPVDEDNPNMEYHEQYIDIQFIAEGCEHIGWADRAGAPTDAYNSQRDIALYPGDAAVDFDVPAGTFAIFFPGDAHKPKMLAGSTPQVKKIVVKVKA